MPTIDFFRRKSQNLSTIIESIYGLRTDDQADKAMAVASQSFTELVGFSLSDVLAMKGNDYLNEILKLHYSLTYLEQTVNFLLETADVFRQLKKMEEMENLTEKAAYILKHIIDTDKTYSPEREIFLKSLEDKINKR